MNAADHVKAIHEARALDEAVSFVAQLAETANKRAKVVELRAGLYDGGMAREYCGWPTTPPRRIGF